MKSLMPLVVFSLFLSAVGGVVEARAGAKSCVGGLNALVVLC